MVTRCRVIWSPSHEDHFIAIRGETLTVYKTVLFDGVDQAKDLIPMGDGVGARMINGFAEPYEIKYFAWNPKPDWHHLGALGLNNGEVVILTLFDDHADVGPASSRTIGTRCRPPSTRIPNALSWNSNSPQLLALSYSKGHAPKDFGLQVFNLNEIMDPTLSSGCKPCFGVGMGEASGSHTWLPDHPSANTIVVSFNKCIRVYNLATDTSEKPTLEVSTRVAEHFLRADPHNPYQFASSTDSQVKVWDVRRFDSPRLVYTLDHATKGFLQLAWDPSRNNLLNVLPKQSHAVRQVLMPGDSRSLEPEVSPLDKYLHIPDLDPPGSDALSPALRETISSFSMHPTVAFRCLVATAGGRMVLHEFTPVPVAVTLAGSGLVRYTDGGKKVLEAAVRPELLPQSRVRDLVKAGYAAGSAAENHDLVRELNPTLVPYVGSVWRWVANILRNFGPYTGLHGAADVVRNEETPQPVQLDFGKLHVTVYESSGRRDLLRVAGWLSPMQRDGEDGLLTDRIDSLSSLEQAALLYTFALRLQDAVNCLTRSPSSTSQLIACAMRAGSVPDRDLSLEDPHLRMLIRFWKGISNVPRGDGLQELLRELVTNPSWESDWDPLDRLGFAARFLSDESLRLVFNDLHQRYTDCDLSPRLDGLILTGLPSPLGVNLLERYVNMTGDVQTAALLLAETRQPLRQPTEPGHPLFVSYLELLDTFGFWMARAKLDAYILNAHREDSFDDEQVCLSYLHF